MDKKRALLRNEFAGRKVNSVDYDLIFNTERMKTEEIVQLIAKASELKGLF